LNNIFSLNGPIKFVVGSLFNPETGRRWRHEQEDAAAAAAAAVKVATALKGASRGGGGGGGGGREAKRRLQATAAAAVEAREKERFSLIADCVKVRRRIASA